MTSKRIAIIGAGASGLTSIKACLEGNLEPFCFEKSHDIGGLWRYEKDEKSGATVYKSTHVNTSKEMMCFSDFPMPKEWPNYLHNTKVLEYFRLYAQRFDLLKHIQFNNEVISCRPDKDFEQTGNWNVTTKCGGKENSEIFAGVMVCVGHHATPYYPLDSFKGVNKFQGSKSHSHSYRTHTGFDGKNVLVVGIGNSGGDIAVELSWHAKQVHLSTRRGNWVLHRVSDKGMPMDFTSSSRLWNFIAQTIPLSWLNAGAESIANLRFDHAHYGLKPEHRIFQQHPMINDDLPNRILNGSIKIKADLKEFEAGSVKFTDGTEENIDSVIFATGYKLGFSFLDEEAVLKLRGNDSDLFMYQWPVTMAKNTLAVIGHVQPLGAVNPISEIQSRWAVRVFKGLNKLPTNSEMSAAVNETRRQLQLRFYASPRHTFEIEYIKHADAIATIIGVKPNLWKIFFTDYKLWKKMIKEGCTPYHYRLVGPDKNHNAREYILTQKERMLFPLHTRPIAEHLKKRPVNNLAYAFVVFLAIAVYYYFF